MKSLGVVLEAPRGEEKVVFLCAGHLVAAAVEEQEEEDVEA